MSFRRKILISYLVVFLVFTILLYPIVTNMIDEIQDRHLQSRVEELINEVTLSENLTQLIANLKSKERFLFFRLTLFGSKGEPLYDSHLSEEEVGPNPSDKRPEVVSALSNTVGSDVRYSSFFRQEMAYMAVRFDFQGQIYVLRAVFPFGRIESLTHDLTLTFSLLGISMLLLFSFLAWFIIHVLTRPVIQILQAIKPFQLGKSEYIPKIRLGREIGPNDEFGQLAETLNALTQQIDSQISFLTHEKDEKSAILESLIEGVVAVDEHLVVKYMNKTAETFLNISEKELVGQKFAIAKQPACEALLLQAQDEGHPIVLVLKPGRKQKRFIDAVAVPRGKRGGAILVLQDKTSLHKVVEMGRDFIANASHELKTPITIIRGFAETLHDHPELSREVYRDITEKIVRNCHRMSTLVRNLLTLAAVDEGLPSSRLQKCHVVDIIEQAIQTVTTVHPEAQIEIKTIGEPPFRLLLDSDLFLQAVLNLLDNAVKYSKQPAHVTVEIEKRENSYLIRVTDRGIGIPQEDLDRIFERFYAVDKSHSRSMGGSGLGLSIVEQIIEKHQGKIEVESEEGKGTTFTITLPAT